MNMDRKFNGIYSDNVSYHLTGENVAKYIQRRKEVLNSGGFLFHFFVNVTKSRKQMICFLHLVIGYLEGGILDYYSDLLYVEMRIETEKR